MQEGRYGGGRGVRPCWREACDGCLYPRGVQKGWKVSEDERGPVECGPRGSQRGRREEVLRGEVCRAEECLRGRRDVGVEREPVWVSVRRGRGSCRPA